MVIAGLAFDNDGGGARELVAELGHRSLDPVKVPRSHHAEWHHLIRLANLDALLLEKGPQDQGVPEGGALNRPRHVHNSDTPYSCEAASGIVAGPVSFPPIARLREFDRVVAVAVPVPGDEHGDQQLHAALRAVPGLVAGDLRVHGGQAWRTAPCPGGAMSSISAISARVLSGGAPAARPGQGHPVTRPSHAAPALAFRKTPGMHGQ